MKNDILNQEETVSCALSDSTDNLCLLVQLKVFPRILFSFCFLNSLSFLASLPPSFPLSTFQMPRETLRF